MNAEDFRRELAERFPDGQPELETPDWHDWARLSGALAIAERAGLSA